MPCISPFEVHIFSQIARVCVLVFVSLFCCFVLHFTCRKSHKSPLIRRTRSNNASTFGTCAHSIVVIRRRRKNYGAVVINDKIKTNREKTHRNWNWNWFITVDHDASLYVATLCRFTHCRCRFFISNSNNNDEKKDSNKQIILQQFMNATAILTDRIFMAQLLCVFVFFFFAINLRLHKSARFSLPQSSSFKMLNELLLLLQIVCVFIYS